MPQRKQGKRTKSGRLSRSKASMIERNPPADYILARRELFAWHRPTKGPDGRVGEIDQDICDAIGQLHACGLLDGHGHDPQELRDKGRLFSELWWRRYNMGDFKMARYERSSRSTANYDGLTPADLLFERLDECLEGFERTCVFDLCVDRAFSDDPVDWAKSLIADNLLSRGKMPPQAWEPIRFATAEARAMLDGAIRGLCHLVDGALPSRYERRAA